MSGVVNPTQVIFTAPQTNVDGSELKDLKEYWIFVSANPSDPWTGTPAAIFPAPELNPPAGEVITIPTAQLGISLSPGQYYGTIKAVDTSGNASAAAPTVPFVLSDTVAPSPPTNLVLQ